MKIFLQTYGCQMANRDSEVIIGFLIKEGYKIVDDDKKADVVIFNTCSVRQHAEDRVFSAIGACHAKIIGVAGCMANNYREAIFKKAPSVDFVIGTRDINKIPKIIKEIEKHKKNKQDKKISETDAKFREDEIYHTGYHLTKDHAFVVISEGCENYCSYCIVPYVRGKFRSRSPEEIIKEIKDDIGAGISRITLLGQNVNQYKSNIDFKDLLYMVNKVEGLKQFDFMTSHPKDAIYALFKTMAECDKLIKHLHLPVQSGSNRILKSMNRGYTKEHYLGLVKKYRDIVKGGVISTDIIVGFPGETEEDFKETYDLVKKVKFNKAYIFKYSPRPHTKALNFVDDVPKQEKERRHGLILDLQREISKKK
ncbi:MAG: tRNA (N6-isopentenyl adenosine(37)-C2)-methylthiotransferase MiaB [Candidatus Omnitrophota bacterium]